MFQAGDWSWSEEHRVVDAQDLWGEVLYRIWLPARDSVVRIRSDRLRPAAAADFCKQAHIVYAVAAARVSDSLTHDVLLAPIGVPVTPIVITARMGVVE